MMEQLTNGEILTEQGNGGARRWYLPFSKLRQPTPEHLNSLDFSPCLPPPIIVSATPRHISGRAFGAVLRRLFPYAPNKRRALGRRKGGKEGDEVGGRSALRPRPNNNNNNRSSRNRGPRENGKRKREAGVRQQASLPRNGSPGLLGGREGGLPINRPHSAQLRVQ